MKEQSKLRDLVSSLPEKPGCYQYLDSSGVIIYVGKAKNLKRRVGSYFVREQQSSKTRMLVGKIADIKYIVVKSEWDALLLENNLIKRYKPKYNILLKDDKTYPSICITNEPLPRVYKTRSINKSLGTFYGPYSNVGRLNALLKLIEELYSVRGCSHKLTEEGIEENIYKECLKYHIKKCKAPCIGLQSASEYRAEIEEIRTILKGDILEISRRISQEMRREATELNFEKAQKLKEKLDVITTFTNRSMVVSPHLDNIDILSIDNDNDIFFLNYMHLSNGAINQAFTFEYKRRMEESSEDLLLMGFTEMRNRYKSRAREVIVPFSPTTSIDGIEWIVPQKGEKRKLLELSLLNVKQYRADRVKRMDKLNPEQKQTRIVKELQLTLGLNKLPLRIECFDNSHISGSNAVAACVVYEKGRPKRNEYRLFQIKSGCGGDDYNSMYEVLQRRYRRLIEEGQPLPDLIVVDGGKGQISVAKRVLSELNISISIAGLVKNRNHRTSGLIEGESGREVGIKPDSELFRLLEQMQNEVHRVAISYHKQRRSKSQIESQLTEIKGIGKRSQEALLKHFKSLKRIKEATQEEIETVIGKNRAEILIKWIKNSDE